MTREISFLLDNRDFSEHRGVKLGSKNMTTIEGDTFFLSTEGSNLGQKNMTSTSRRGYFLHRGVKLGSKKYDQQYK